MIASMTGYATRKGQGQGANWQWEVRSVNAKGLDLRLRLPDWIDGLEPLVRAAFVRHAQRGSISLTLKVLRDGGAEPLRVNHATLGAVLAGLAEVTEAATKRGQILHPPSAAEVLNMRGVLEQAIAEDDDMGPLRDALMADLPPLLNDFIASRGAEGAALAVVIVAQVDLIEALTLDARAEAFARRDAMAAGLRDSVARVLANAAGVDEARIAQEIALLAVKADVTEEVDRLTAHVAAARALMAEAGAVGRKLDFLTQEFNREANTLCSKAQAIALTRIGLDLKAVVDQMREQVQNVE